MDKAAAGRELAAADQKVSLHHEGNGDWQWPVGYVCRSKSLPKGGGDGPAGTKNGYDEFDIHTLGGKKFIPRSDHPDDVIVRGGGKDDKAPKRVFKDKAAGRPLQSHASGAILAFSRSGMVLRDKSPTKKALEPDICPIVPNEDPNVAPSTSAYRTHFSARPGIPEPVNRPEPVQSPRVPLMAVTVPAPSEPPRPGRFVRAPSNPRSGPIPGGFTGPPNGIDDWGGDKTRGPKVPVPERLHDYPWGKIDTYASTKAQRELVNLKVNTIREQTLMRSALDQQVEARDQRIQRQRDEDKRFHSCQEADIVRYKENEAARARAAAERIRLTQRQLDAQVQETHTAREALQKQKRDADQKLLRENEATTKRLQEAEKEKARQKRAEVAAAYYASLGDAEVKKGQKRKEQEEDKKIAASWGKTLADQDDRRDQEKEQQLQKHQHKGSVGPRDAFPGGRMAEDRAIEERKMLEAREKSQETAKAQRMQSLRQEVKTFNDSAQLSRREEKQRQRKKKEEIRSEVEKEILAAKQDEAEKRASVRAKNVAHRHDLEDQIKSRPPPGPRWAMTDPEVRLNRRIIGLIESSEAS